MKLITTYIVYNENNLFFKGSLESVLPHVDGVVIIDGGSKDGTLEYLDNLNNNKIHVIHVPYRHDLKEANGMQRNEYLKWIGRIFGYEDTWVLVIDGDEILADDGYLLREIASNPFIFENERIYVYSLQMVHFIHNLGHIDSTLNGGPAVDPTWKHFSAPRFFKLTPELYYDEVEHPLLRGWNGKQVGLDNPILYHLGYVKGMESIIKKGQNHRNKSNIHTPEFLTWWIQSHLSGSYPVRDIRPEEIKSMVIQEWLK